MFRITDERGHTYYMTTANMPEYYQSFDEKLVGAVSFIRHEAEQGAWLKCYTDSMLRDVVAVRADAIYIVEEKK